MNESRAEIRESIPQAGLFVALERPFLQFYPGDYFSDTMHLTARQHGAYCCLIFRYWQAGGPLPDIDASLARLASETPNEWAEDGPVLRAFFRPIVIDAKPKLRHKRLEQMIDEIQGSASRRRNQTRRARYAAQQAAERLRAGKDETGDEGPTKKTKTGQSTGSQPIEYEGFFSVTDAQQTLLQGGDSDSDSDSYRKVESPNGLSRPKLAKGDFGQFWDSVPKKVGKRTAKLAYERALTRGSAELIGEGMKRYAASRAGEDERYTAHAATWLNRDGWLDQAPTAGVNGATEMSWSAKVAAMKANETC